MAPRSAPLNIKYFNKLKLFRLRGSIRIYTVVSILKNLFAPISSKRLYDDLREYVGTLHFGKKIKGSIVNISKNNYLEVKKNDLVGVFKFLHFVKVQNK